MAISVLPQPPELTERVYQRKFIYIFALLNNERRQQWIYPHGQHPLPSPLQLSHMVSWQQMWTLLCYAQENANIISDGIVLHISWAST